MKPKVLILTLGGTIAMTHDPLDAGGAGGPGVRPRLTGEMLVASVPRLSEIAAIEVRSFRQIPGAHLTFADLEALAVAVREATEQGAGGIVVVQGTDTIEETAFALDRLLDVDAPVVVTGAMRNPSALGAEGPANLMAAVRVAAGDEARGLGCVVVINDEVHAARFVRKVHTSSLAAFASPNAGPLGWIVEDRVRIVTRVARVPSVARSARMPEHVACDGRVVMLSVGIGDDGLTVDLLQSGVDGLVIQATGGGHVSPALADALERAALRMPVVLTSRASGGETLACTYGFIGGEIDLQRRGLVRSGWLDGVKARVLLALLLRTGHRERASIARWFEPWGGLGRPT